MVAAMLLKRHGVPGSHHGRLAVLARLDEGMARVYGRLQKLYFEDEATSA
jgi:hypothetical protein